jgi:hypothetical protein
VDTAFVNGLFRKFPRIRESLEYVLSELRLGGVKLLKLSKQVLSFFCLEKLPRYNSQRA